MARIIIDKKIVKYAVAKADEAPRQAGRASRSAAVNPTSSGCTRSSSVRKC